VPARGGWKPARSIQLGRLPALLAVATVVLALLIGLAAGDLVGRNSVAPAAAQVAGYPLVGSVTLPGARGTVVNVYVEDDSFVTSAPPAPAKGRSTSLAHHARRSPDFRRGVRARCTGGKVVLVGSFPTGYSQMAVTAETGPTDPGTQSAA
jgi:hypothetical protein